MPGLFENAVALERAGRLAEAEQLCRQIVASEPQHSGALLMLGMVRAKSGDFTNALTFLNRSLGIRPEVAVGHYYRAAVLSGLGRTEEALASSRRAVEIDPDFAEAHCGAGSLLLAAGRLEEALAAFDRSLALRPELDEARCYKAVALVRLKRNDEALMEFDVFLAKYPDHAVALGLRGKLHFECGRYAEALQDCDRSLAISETQDALATRASVFRAQHRFEEAQADIDRAVALDPRTPKPLFVRGLVHVDFGRLREALADFQAVVAVLPTDVPALSNLGSTLCSLGRHDEALAAYNRAIAIDENFAAAYFGRGEVWRRLLRDELAFADFERAAELDPSLAQEASMRLHLGDLICEWKGRASRVDDLVLRIRKGERVNPWITFSIFDDPEIHLMAARAIAEPPVAGAAPRRARPHARLRIAYLSPDFRDHVLACQIVELIERHDKTRFEIFGISLVDWPMSPILERLSKAFEHFIEAGSRDDREIAELMASLEIDIAVDLAGYTDRHRSRVFAYRPAPLAVSYLGYPGTTGSANIDYVLGDAVIIPPENERFFTESVVRLPDCFFPVDTTMPCLEAGTRVEAGLPETGFVFCAFNNAYKLSPAMFDIWMRLLQAVQGSVLWINVLNERAKANLRAEARARGVPPDRLVFTAREPVRWRHFARLRFADLHLDCVPYNAHSTATDMLRVGVPVLTCLGRSYAARVASSMLTTIGLPELIAHDLEEYERIALELAQSPTRLAEIRAKLAANHAQNPAFDMTRLARQIERAYETMWKLHLDGAAPQSFTVARS